MRIPYIVFWLDITIFGLIGIIRNDSYLLMTFIVCAVGVWYLPHNRRIFFKILGSILSCFFICNIAYLAYRKSQVQHGQLKFFLLIFDILPLAETDDIVMWELMWIMAHVFYGVFFSQLFSNNSIRILFYSSPRLLLPRIAHWGVISLQIFSKWHF